MVSIKSLAAAVIAFSATALGADNARITYYDNQNAGNVNFGACEIPVGTMKAASGLEDNGNKQACGKCINVHYGGKTVKYQVSRASSPILRPITDDTFRSSTSVRATRRVRPTASMAGRWTVSFASV